MVGVSRLGFAPLSARLLVHAGLAARQSDRDVRDVLSQAAATDQRDQEIIEQITHLAGVAIQHKLAQEKLQRSEAYLAETEKLTHTGSWAWDVRTQKVLYCSDEMFRIFGLDPLESLPTRKNFRQRIHPEDRDWVDKRFERLLREKVDSFDEYRALLPDGTVKHIMSSGHPDFR